MQGVLFLFVTLTSWASVLLFLRHLSTYIDGWTANGWRYSLSALLLAPMLLIRLRRGKVHRSIWRKALIPTLFNCIGQTFFGFGVYFIEPGLAGFLQRVSLVSSTLGAFILFSDERRLLRNRLFWMGLTLIVAGSVGTVAFGTKPLQGDSIVGITLAASSGLFFGLYGVSVRACMGGIRSTDSFAAIASLTACIMLLLMFWRSPTHGTAVVQMSPNNIFLLGISSIIGIAIGHVFYYAAIARLGVATASAIVQLSPFLCAAGSVYFFSEMLTPAQWIAGLTMLGGAGLLIRAQNRGLETPLPGPTDDALSPLPPTGPAVNIALVPVGSAAAAPKESPP